MKRVWGNFRVWRWPPRWLWLLALISVVAATSVGLWALHERQEVGAARARIAQMKQARLSALPPAPAPAGPKPYERSAREFLNERALPWPQAMTSLEATAMVGVTPRAVEANAADASVRVEVVATDLSRVLAYLDALNAASASDADELRWTLLSSQSDSTGTGRIAVIVGRRQVVSNAERRP